MHELSDILFFIKSIKAPNNSFTIFQYVSFNNSNTRSSNKKLYHKLTTNSISTNSYFLDFLNCGM